MNKLEIEAVYRTLDKYSSEGDTILDLDDPEELSGENDDFKLESEIDSHGGEGEGEVYRVISKLTIKDTGEVILIQFSGHYSSWDGVEWGDWSIVKPVQVSVTRYENIN